MIDCPGCARPLPDERARFCPFCGVALPGGSVTSAGGDPAWALPTGALEARSAPAEVPAEAWPVPWEQRATLGFIQGYWQTTKAVMSTPTQAFERMAPITGRWWDPLSYSMVSSFLGVSGILVIYLAAFGVVGVVGFVQEKTKIAPSEGLMVAAIIGLIVVMFLILIPLSAIMSAFVMGGLEHLMLKLVGVKTRGFEATLRGTCYSTAPMILGAIPLCGAYVYPVWQLVCRIFAYRGLPKTTGGRATAAVLLPLVLCCGIAAFAYAFIFAAAIATSALTNK
jgi:hypothetical protein